jgi:hypothetical protein
MFGQERRVALFAVTLLLVFSLNNPANAATIAFKPPVSYPVGTNPGGVYVADFNGDGKLDLAVVNHGLSDTGDDGGVSILLGDGDGTFQAARNFSAGKLPESIAIADFNSDGKLDIIAVSESENVLNVLLGNGDGTFQPRFTVTIDDIDPYYVVAGDFNNDHKWDIAVSGLGRDLNGDGIRDSVGGTTVLLGNGDGTFEKHGPLLPLSLSEAADFNQDGRLDLAVVMFPGFDVFLGTGDGSFQAPISNTEGGGVGYAVDFNRDGKLDLVAFLPTHVCGLKLCDGQIDVLLGNGDGTFSSSFSQTGPYRTLTVGDFDGDGNLDLALNDAGAGHPSHVLRGDGKGNFVAAGTFVVNNTLSLAHLMAADFNGDNLADLVSTGDNNTITVRLNATPPDFLFDVSPANLPLVPAGGSATLTLTAVSQAGFGGDIKLSCSSPAAQGINCSFSPSSVTPGSSAALTITTTGGSAARTPPRTTMRFLYALCLPMLGLAFAGFGFTGPHQRKGSLANATLCFFLFGGILLQAACGGNNSNSGTHGTPAGNYTITVTGTSGSTQHSTTTTLTVQ